MSDLKTPESQPTGEPDESFDQILSQYEQTHSHKARLKMAASSSKAR